MICQICSADNPEDCLYCPKCGKPTIASAEAAAASIVQPAPVPVANPVTVVLFDTQTAGSAEDDSAVATQSDSGGDPMPPADMPERENTLLAQANLSRLRKNWVEATELCVSVLKLRPADHAAHSLLGDIYRDQGKLEEAVRWYRMALDLKPNPFDQSNLQKLEQQIARQNLSSGRKDASARRQIAIYPDAGQSATGALGGVSQQAWLKGITIASVVFLFAFVVYLKFAPIKATDSVPKPLTSGTTSDFHTATSDGLPPPRLGGPTALPPGEQSGRTVPMQHVAGTGIAPDTGSVTVPTMQPSASDRSSHDVPPAAVNGVTPLPGQNNRIGALQQPRADISPSTHSNSLTSGMQLTKVESGHGSAAIYIAASDGANTPALREAMIRNLYRAATTVFNNDNTVMTATVVFTNGSANGEVLASATIDRASALAADPDHDSAEQLNSRVKVH